MTSGPAVLVQSQPGTSGSGPGRTSRSGPARRAVTRRGLLRLISPVVLLLLWQGESALKITDDFYSAALIPTKVDFANFSYTRFNSVVGGSS